MLSPRERIEAILSDLEFLRHIGTPVSQREIEQCHREIDECWMLMGAGVPADMRIMILPGGNA